MQTHRDSAVGVRAGGLRAVVARLLPRHVSRLAAIAAACALVAPLAGCAAPHLESRNADASKLGTCESAYLAAQTGTPALSDGYAAMPTMMRYLVTRAAGEAWITVASACTSRFAEGAMRSAQVSYAAETLGAALGVASPTPPTVDYGDVVRLDAGADALSAMSLAEDRAGFALEVLAARGVGNATLAASDNHKTAAQRLFSLSGASKDPRQKVYAVDQLIAHPDTIEDAAAPGVTAPTVAVIEMDCARAYLDAMRGDDGAAGDSGASGSGTTSGTDAGSSTTSAGSSEASDSSDAAASPSRKTLDWLARMAAARAWRAMELGYPSADSALFR
ncbi:hypothetical protein [Bifidobacterium stellenboschense]|uniref:Uncharacterized protein n=1 Tax=Bifidobacterium stellenboschense TaxID=762211 RepID=A0A087DNG7_9BIFI|nr:hypothetical protein [Bifidobacterium stellenboschense]KFI97067.1 hypothetical protein BSTEL_1978 [Bifidobacterium stellenboschense]